MSVTGGSLVSRALWYNLIPSPSQPHLATCSFDLVISSSVDVVSIWSIVMVLVVAIKQLISY